MLKQLSVFHLLFLSSSGNIFHPNPGISYGLSHQAILKAVHPMRACTPSPQALVYFIKSYSPDWGEETRMDSILGEEKQALVLAVAAVCCNSCYTRTSVKVGNGHVAIWSLVSIVTNQGRSRTGPQRKTRGLGRHAWISLTITPNAADGSILWPCSLILTLALVLPSSGRHCCRTTGLFLST